MIPLNYKVNKIKHCSIVKNRIQSSSSVSKVVKWRNIWNAVHSPLVYVISGADVFELTRNLTIDIMYVLVELWWVPIR